jgi:hypothetical protein
VSKRKRAARAAKRERNRELAEQRAHAAGRRHQRERRAAGAALPRLDGQRVETRIQPGEPAMRHGSPLGRGGFELWRR